jgi:O-antigen ligase
VGLGLQTRAPDWPRLALIAGAAAVLLLCTTGLPAAKAFDVASPLKYGLTVGGPLLVIVLAVAQAPLRLSVGLLVFAIPFGSATATFSGVGIPFMAVLLALATVVAVVSGPLPGLASPAGGRVILASGLLAVPAVIGGQSGRFLTLLATMALVGWLVSRACDEPRGVDFVLGAGIAAGVLQGLLAIYEFRTGNHLSLYGSAQAATAKDTYYAVDGNANRPYGSFYDPISLGNVLAATLPLAVDRAVRARGGLVRLAAYAATGVIAFGLILTFSRLSWIGGTVGVLVAIALLPRGRRLATIASLGVMVAVLVGVAAATAGPALQERFDSVKNPTQSRNATTAEGDRQRERLWRASLDVAETHPVVGVGLGNLRPQLEQRVADLGPSTHAHSTYLQLLAEGGLVGAAALVMLFSGLAGAIRRGLLAGSLLAPALAGSFVSFALCWLTDVTVRYSPVASFAAVLIGLACAMDRRAGGT